MAPENGFLVWQLLQLIILAGGAFVAFLVIRLLWRTNFLKK